MNICGSMRDKKALASLAAGFDHDAALMAQIIDANPCKSHMVEPIVETIMINGIVYPVNGMTVWINGYPYRVVSELKIRHANIDEVKMPSLGEEPKKQAKQPKPYAKFNTFKKQQRRS